jgi:hypothetical protein
VLGIGIWTLVDKSFMNELLGTNLFLGAVYILIATGAIISLIAFFGCLGALKEIKCMLLTVSQLYLYYMDNDPDSKLYKLINLNTVLRFIHRGP